MTNNHLDKLIALITARKVCVEKHAGCNPEREHVERIGKQHFRVEEHDPEWTWRESIDDGFLLVFSLLEETNSNYNATRTLIFELVARDCVQLVQDDCVLEPYLCAQTVVRPEYQKLYEKEKANIQQAWTDFELAIKKLAELNLAFPVDVKAPEQKRDAEPHLPLQCYDSVYTIDYSQVRWSMYVDRTTDIWKALIRADYF